jgi:HlyD family secretion protein
MRILSRIHGWKLPLIGAVGLVFALVSVLGRPEPQSHEPLVIPPTTSFSTQVAGIGVVEPKSEIINLGVELPGVVRQVLVAVGDDVKRGAPLFALDQREVDAQIATFEATLASSRVQAADAEAQYALIASVRDKRAVAKDEVNRRQFAKQLAKARVKEIEAQLQQAKTTKQRLSVKAPIDGRVLELNVRPGEYAAAGVLAAPLVRMGDISTLYVRVEVDEENAARIRPDSKAEGMFRGDTTTRIPLTFVRFEPYVRAKQNLAVSGQRVDTRVLQIIYALPEELSDRFVGQQMDVFIDEPTPEKGA